MNTYMFKCKKGLFWKKIKAIGHSLQAEVDRMDIYHANGSVTSLSGWSKYDLHLGTDWVLFTKKQIEKESGQKINLDVESE